MRLDLDPSLFAKNKTLVRVLLALVAITTFIVAVFTIGWWWTLGVITFTTLTISVLYRLARKGWFHLKPIIDVATSETAITGGVEEPMPIKYRALITLIYLAFFVLFAALAAITTMFAGWIGLAWMAFAGVFATYYTLSSFRTVGPDEQAAKLFFGNPIQNLDSGLCFVPLGICDLRVLTKNIFDFYIGQERDPDGKVVERKYEGVVLASNEPFRVTFASSDHAIWTFADSSRTQSPAATLAIEEVVANFKTEEGKEDPLNHRLTTDPRVAVLGRIVNPKQFVSAVRDLNSAYRKIEKMVVSTLQEYCAQRTPSFVLYFLDDAVTTIKMKVEGLIGDPDAQVPAGFVRWGIDITEVKITSMGIDYAINAAMVAARSASYTKRATREAGSGTAQARQLLLEAEAAGQAAWGKALEALPPDLRQLIVTANAMKEAVTKAQLVLTQPNDLLGMFASAQKVLGVGRDVSQGSQQTQPPPTAGGDGNKPRGSKSQKRGRRSDGSGQSDQQGPQGPQPTGPTPATT